MSGDCCKQRPRRCCVAVLLAAALAGCSRRSPPSEAQSSARVVRIDRGDLPIAQASAVDLQRFAVGDGLFDVNFRPVDGLGPLFIRSSCGACHKDDGRGPGLVGKMAALLADKKTLSGTPLPFGNTERPYVTAGAKTPLSPAALDVPVRLSYRLPPAVFGRGYMEAVADSEILRLEKLAQQRGATDPQAPRGRINRVAYNSEPNPDRSVHQHTKGAQELIGRFGLKARLATLDEFTADAFQGDMGLSSILRPQEPPNPDGKSDDEHPGIDLPIDTINEISHYMRLLAIPPRHAADRAAEQLFARIGCAVCHVPVLRTRSDYPLPALANTDAPVFTDFLLHDMGEGLSDGISEGLAGPRDFRTAPLIGLRFQTAYLHDGRARTVEDAIRAHNAPDGEAVAASRAFAALPPALRKQLIDYVAGL